MLTFITLVALASVGVGLYTIRATVTTLAIIFTVVVSIVIGTTHTSTVVETIVSTEVTNSSL